MIKNYFLTTWRNLTRNKTFSAINILGLSLGMACSLLIILWVNDERGVDGFHANGKNLYQIFERAYYDGKVDAGFPTQGFLAKELKRQIPEIQHASSLEWNSVNTFEAGGKINKMTGCFAGADFFRMFSFPLIAGTADAALNRENGIAISRKMAEMFFGSADKAMGQQIRYENEQNFQVTAVFKDIPDNSSFSFDFLRNWQAFEKENSNWISNWGNTDPQTFVQLKAGTDPVIVRAKIKDFIYRYKETSKAYRVELDLLPFPEKYLHSQFKNGQVADGRIQYVRLFSLIAILIMLVACINFMNLATARASKRAKEVGVRKVIGAPRASLILQFMGEAVLLTFLSMAVALLITSIALPAFNDLTGKSLNIPWKQPPFWMGILLLGMITGIIAGSYPALFLSSLLPIKVLKGNLRFGWKASFFRRGLVIFQFSLSILLMIAMIVITRQLQYIQSKNIGYDRGNLVYLPIEGELATKYPLFKETILNLPSIREVSKMRQSPTEIHNHTGDISWSGKDPNLLVSFVNSTVGYDFVKTLDLRLADGRDFSKSFGEDSANFLVNETAVQKMGLKDPVGKTIWWGKHAGKVIGVIKDFHFASLHIAIEPFIARLEDNRESGNILVRIQPGKTREALAAMKSVCQTINPKFPFSYQFSDEQYAEMYQSETVVGKLSDLFAILAIFISCLGLFGLATFTAEQRTKEIGVRKVLGASVPNIVRLLAANFLRPVIISMLIGFPLAAVTMTRWLDDFQYKVTLDWWIFGIAGVSTIMIALATVSFQSIRAAITNPIRTLRNE